MKSPADLEGRLAERVHTEGAAAVCEDRAFVLYWMRTAVRGHENPALDVAQTVADALGKPLLVYHAVSERYPFASDRHHAFILQGARDVAAELAERGVAYACHVEREGHRGPWLEDLAGRAALVVTEDMPVPPLRQWTRRLARTAGCAIWQVDTACVLPMRLVEQRPERAFAFRRATARERGERLRAGAWMDVLPAGDRPALDVFQLPFTPVEIESEDLEELIGRCEIDHGVGPVADTVGGSRAGYERWDAFVREGLRHYAKRRNDAISYRAVSRLSAYLHYGHVSPLRIAREAAASELAGGDKYLDELLIWRELAHAWCWHHEGDVETDAVLPAWAVETLEQHERDPRPALPSWDTLSRGRIGDSLWDAAQHSLLRHGELHNNVRMTWGKALLQWTPDLSAALQMLVDLNHRYALDGRDPSSYGGLYWCAGLFDRPFEPAEAVTGKVRGRSTAMHAKRLDVAKWRSRVIERSIVASGRDEPRIAVVGAGLAGLSCARTLADHGLDVVVFDKGRGPGGRTSTRRADGGLRFDHGAQYFTARSEPFRRHVAAWQQDGVVAEWEGRIVSVSAGTLGPDPRPGVRYVGVPGMNALCKHLGAELDVRFGSRVAELRQDGARNLLVGESGELLDAAPFDLVVHAIPATQAQQLLATAAPTLAARAADVVTAPCVAVMLAFDEALDLPFDGAFATDSALGWVARDSSKPGRDQATDRWVLHAGPEWSASHVEQSPEQWCASLSEAFADLVGRALPDPCHASGHRWLYALPTSPLPERSLFDGTAGIGLCGDWCGGPRVEGAWRSGQELAGRILRRLTMR